MRLTSSSGVIVGVAACMSARLRVSWELQLADFWFGFGSILFRCVCALRVLSGFI